MSFQYKRLLYLLIIAIVWISAITAHELANPPESLENLELKHILSARVLPERVGVILAPEKGYVLDLNNPDERKIVFTIINEIETGEVKSEDIGEVRGSKASTRVELKLKDGDTILLVSTMGISQEPTSNGGITEVSYNVDDQVTINYVSRNKPMLGIRKVCPETKRLIENELMLLSKKALK